VIKPLPQVPHAGAKQQTHLPTLCAGRPACCPEGTASRWLQQDAPPSQRALAPPLERNRAKSISQGINLYFLSHFQYLSRAVFKIGTSHRQTGMGGQHTFAGSSRCSAAGSCCSAHFQKPLQVSGVD